MKTACLIFSAIHLWETPKIFNSHAPVLGHPEARAMPAFTGKTSEGRVRVPNLRLLGAVGIVLHRWLGPPFKWVEMTERELSDRLENIKSVDEGQGGSDSSIKCQELEQGCDLEPTGQSGNSSSQS